MTLVPSKCVGMKSPQTPNCHAAIIREPVLISLTRPEVPVVLYSTGRP